MSTRLGLVAAATALVAPVATTLAVAPAQAASAPVTHFISSHPWSTAGALRVHASTSVAPRGSQCIASSTTGRADAYRCFLGNQIIDPAFKSPRSNSLAWLSGNRWHVTTGVRTFSTMPSADAAIWRVRLANGATCVAASGAGPAPVQGYPNWVGVCTGGPIARGSLAIWRAPAQSSSKAWPLVATNAAHTTWSAAVQLSQGSSRVVLMPVATALR